MNNIGTATFIKREKIILVSFLPNELIEEELDKFSPKKKKYRKNYFGKIENLWELPSSAKLIYFLDLLKFDFSKSLKELVWNVKLKQETKLYPFQVDGVKFIEKKGGRALIADEMGLGKTVQAITWLKLSKTAPALIICPSSMKVKWKEELKTWMGVDAEILYGTKPYKIRSDYVIINYDILHYWVQTIKMKEFEVMIADEAHMVKSNKARRTKAFKKLKDIPNLIALTGTPILNRPIEIYNIVQAINPEVFPNYIGFTQRFCGAKKGRFGWDFSGATNTKKLNLILTNTVMIRRTKKQVLKELPPKIITSIPIEIDNSTEYQKAETEFITFLSDRFNKISEAEIEQELKAFAKRNKIKVSEQLTQKEISILRRRKIEKASLAPILSQIEVLKQLATKGKMEQMISWIEDFLESGEKLVVFATHKKTISTLMERFPNSVKIEGGMTDDQKWKVQEAFQNDPKVKLFIGNIKAAGVGLTLTAASNAAILEFPWSPGDLSQAGDRVHRITQTKQVTIWYIVGKDTIEERIINLLKKKEKIIAQIIDGKREGKESSILQDLINTYQK